jgi:hypothetical protein
MLSSRSTRLAATLLLALLFGWTVRVWRKGGTTAIPSATPAIIAPINDTPKNSFPDE